MSSHLLHRVGEREGRENTKRILLYYPYITTHVYLEHVYIQGISLSLKLISKAYIYGKGTKILEHTISDFPS